MELSAGALFDAPNAVYFLAERRSIHLDHDPSLGALAAARAKMPRPHCHALRGKLKRFRGRVVAFNGPISYEAGSSSIAAPPAVPCRAVCVVARVSDGRAAIHHASIGARPFVRPSGRLSIQGHKLPGRFFLLLLFSSALVPVRAFFTGASLSSPIASISSAID